MQMYTDGSINYIKSATDGGGAFPISIHSGSSEVINIDDGNTQIKTGLKDKDGNLGSSGQVLSSTGSQIDWIDKSTVSFPSGTRMMFQQSSAPTGWTKDTTDVHQRALRVTSGNVSSGGNTDFTDAFRNWTTNNHTLTTSQIPSHRHWVSRARRDDNNFSQWNTNTQEFGLYSDAGSYSANDQNHSVGRNTAYSGGGGAHNHGTMNFAVRYLDVIICSKD